MGCSFPVDDDTFLGTRIYVWFDAVIGYYSASKEWATLTGNPNSWRKWWQEDARSYYFIGKDNIAFHTIIWPALLIRCGIPALPYDVAANEFLNYEGEKMSTSRNHALWARDVQTRYAPDAIRYYLAANAPEGRDTSWYATDFVRRNNDELVATWGNLANRVLAIAHRHFGSVPEANQQTSADLELLEECESAFRSEGESLDRVQLKAGLNQIMALAARANQYISAQEPWRLVQTHATRAATVVHTALQTLDNLKTLFSPLFPFSSQTLHELLGHEETIKETPHLETADDPDGRTRKILTASHKTRLHWAPQPLRVGQHLKEPRPLFERIVF